MTQMRVTVIGAGVAGLTTALALAKQGARVGVLEQSPALGMNACSWFAGGMLAPWCEGPGAHELVTRLGCEALDYWPATVPSTVVAGSLVLSQQRDGSELDRFARQASRYESLDADGVARLEPDLAGRFRRGLFFPGEAHLDPRAVLPALADTLARHGVAIQLGVGDAYAGAGDAVVDCRGLAARDRLPGLRGVKGEMLLIHTREITLSRPVRLLHPRFPLYVIPRGNGLFMVGATTIESDERRRVSARSVVELLNAAYALHPAFAEAEIVEIGCDARPAFPDNLPRIVRRGGTVFVNGLYRHGFLLSPAMARMAADVVLNGALFPEVMDEDHVER